MTEPTKSLLTTGEAARQITAETGAYVSEDDIRKLYWRRILPAPETHGGRIVILASDLTQITRALVEQGVVPAMPIHAVGPGDLS